MATTTYGLLDLIFYPILKALGNHLPKCETCKKKMSRGENPRLFLLPVTFGEEYTPSKEYYRTNCAPIRSVSEIPTGQRACRFWELTCPECRQRHILVEDFLRVRNTETVEQRSLYDAADFADLLF